MIEPNISKSRLFKELGYQPHPKQQLYHDSKARYRVPCCGRRFGKSQAVGHEMTWRMFIPDTMHWIVGTTYTTGEKEFRVVYNDLFRHLKLHDLRGVRRSYNVEQGNMRIQMPWNAVLEVKSADKQDSLIGEGLDSCILAEAAVHKTDTFKMYVEPALLDKRGVCDFPSTPRGHNWYEGIWLQGQDPEFDYIESWRFPTWENTALFPLGYEDPAIQEIKNSGISEFHWLQEYCAEFTALEGRIYGEFDRQIHVTDISYNPYWNNYQSYDFGFADPFVTLDIMADPSDNLYIWREYQVRRKTNTEHALALASRENPDGYHVDGRFGDPRDPDAIRTLNMILSGPKIIGRPLGAKNGISEKLQGYEFIKQWLKVQRDGKPKIFIDRSCKDLIRQMEQLQSPSEREGHNAKEGQREFDDHGPDALRYFVNEYFLIGYERDELAGIMDLYNDTNRGIFAYDSVLRLGAASGFRL
jgi:hypothetical protein